MTSNTDIFETARPKLAIWQRIKMFLESYSPVMDQEIRRLLWLLYLDSPERPSWSFIEMLSDFLNVRIKFFINLAWAKINSSTFAEDRLDIKQDLGKIDRLICSAELELSKYKNASRYLSRQEFAFQLALLRSLNEEPLLADEVRFVIDDYRCPVRLRIVRLNGVDPVCNEPVHIPPLPSLAENDLIGQEMRSMGFLWHWDLGRVVVGDWNFLVIELENHELGIPVTEILSKIGGCPLENLPKAPNEGYDMLHKSCHCGWSFICPGSDLIRAWTLKELAKKIWEIQQRETTIQNIFPEFKRLAMKQLK